MSELNRVIEERLSATEAAATSAASAAADAASAADAAQSSADTVAAAVAALDSTVEALQTDTLVHDEGSEPGSPKNGDTWFTGAALKMRCGGNWFTIDGAMDE